MSVTLYEANITPILCNITSCKAILAKAITWATANSIDQKALLQEARLAPDMLPLAFHFYIVADIARHFVNRMRDETPIKDDFTQFETLESVEKLIKEAEEKLKSITVEEIEEKRQKLVVMNIGPVKYEVTLEGLVTGHSLPNIFFHTVTTYSLLRSKGVELGKADFITSFIGPVLAAGKAL